MYFYVRIYILNEKSNTCKREWGIVSWNLLIGQLCKWYVTTYTLLSNKKEHDMSPVSILLGVHMYSGSWK